MCYVYIYFTTKSRVMNKNFFVIQMSIHAHMHCERTEWNLILVESLNVF